MLGYSSFPLGTVYLSRMREEKRKANFDRRPKRGIRASVKPEVVEDIDDIASWVNKSRQLDEKKKAEEREKAARMAKALEEQVGSIHYPCCCMHAYSACSLLKGALRCCF